MLSHYSVATVSQIRWVPATSCDLVTMNELATISCTMLRSAVPSLQSFLEEYVEALDPEAGIDEEYSPKQDKLLGNDYSWRVLKQNGDTTMTAKDAPHVSTNDRGDDESDQNEALHRRKMEADARDRLIEQEETCRGSNQLGSIVLFYSSSSSSLVYTRAMRLLCFFRSFVIC